MTLFEYIIIQEASSERYLQISHTALSRNAFHAYSLFCPCGVQCTRFPNHLRGLCRHISPCTLFHAGLSDVDGRGGIAYVQEIGPSLQ